MCRFYTRHKLQITNRQLQLTLLQKTDVVQVGASFYFCREFVIHTWSVCLSEMSPKNSSQSGSRYLLVFYCNWDRCFGGVVFAIFSFPNIFVPADIFIGQVC
jgi:hypothetical protein